MTFKMKLLKPKVILILGRLFVGHFFFTFADCSSVVAAAAENPNKKQSSKERGIN